MLEFGSAFKTHTASPNTRLTTARRVCLQPTRARAVVGASMQLAEEGTVRIYSSPGCSYCGRAKSWLQKLGVPYTEVDVSSNTPLRQKLQQGTGQTSVPQIFVGEGYVGGYEDLIREDEEGSLLSRLERAGISMSPVAVAAVEALVEPPSALPPHLLPIGGILNNLTTTTSDAARHEGDLEVEAVALGMQSKMLAMLDEFVSPSGDGVDYGRLVRSDQFHEYRTMSQELSSVSLHKLTSLSPDAQFCFWVNLYNSLVVHGLAVMGAPTTPADRTNFYTGLTGVQYLIGGFTFCLDDIEHGVLRCNRLVSFSKPPQFGSEDPRLVLNSHLSFDSRLHFALNCGARSCPPIKLYTPDNLKEALSLAAATFCAAEVEVSADDTVILSKIFLWYREDFGGSDEAVVSSISGFLPSTSPLRMKLQQLLTKSTPLQLSFKDYNWSLNSLG